MNNTLVAKLSIFGLFFLTLILGCSGGSKEKEPEIPIEPPAPPLEFTEIEFAGEQLFFVHGSTLYASNLDGEFSVLKEDEAINGVGDYVVSMLRVYSPDGSFVSKEYLGNTTSLKGESVAYIVGENDEIIKLDATLTYPEIDISETMAFFGSIDIRTAVFHGDNLLLSFVDENGGMNQYINIENNFIQISGKRTLSVVASENNDKLFISSSNHLYLFDYNSLNTTVFDSVLPTLVYRIDGDVYYSRGNELNRFNESIYSFDHVEIPDELGFINDAAHYEGFDYFATSTGIWKVDLANDIFERLIEI